MKYGISEEAIQKIQVWLGTGSINIFGLPFSGKDTQGARLAELFNAPLIGGGDIIRRSEREDIKKIVADGTLAPQQDYLDMVMPYLSKKEYSGKPLILSSVGRWHGEEKSIIKSAKESRHPQKAVILLDISDTELRKRWSEARETGARGARADDAEEHIENRINEFNVKTKPVLDFYHNMGLLITIDGTLSPNEVTRQIFEKLEALTA